MKVDVTAENRPAYSSGKSINATIGADERKNTDEDQRGIQV